MTKFRIVITHTPGDPFPYFARAYRNDNHAAFVSGNSREEVISEITRILNDKRKITTEEIYLEI